ncbi:hypothetical protein [Streptomyces otsuchiensis]|uniref:hypothetical protein n=1 Tax=Streptomyces otsuchiensis TaxID=2681388 RepID=UPI00102FCEA8|nr:hypothetical protein [Streptomyces otsuchiensis]
MTERDRDRGEGRDPLDEEAAWAEIVAAYGEEPAVPSSGPGDTPPGIWHPDAVPDHSGAVASRGKTADGTEDPPSDADPPAADGPGPPAEGGADAAPHEAAEINRLGENGQWDGPGPRDWAPEDDGDEGHFVPPEPPPLPESDMITRFAWLGVVGGPLLLVGCALLDIDMTWWLTTAGVGGFLGGFATLVLGMRDDRDDEWTDPGSGAVV